MTLKQKTIIALTWSFIDNSARQGVQFIAGIILARILAPREFGLIGMITIFIAVSESFINSGFSNALIRKKECTQADYSTVFYFNLTIGVIFYLTLFFSAGMISAFFDEPQLKAILQVIGLVLIIFALTIIQRTILVKRIDFKLLTRISVISALLSGIIGISMAYAGFGVWSLVARTLAGAFFTSFFLWLWNRWKPALVFSIQSFKELFGFGSKLLLSGLIDTVYRNVYYLVIGKYFSAQELGYYTRASQFKAVPSQNISGVMSRVTYPVLAQLQDNKELLKAAYKRLVKSVMLISFVLMIGLSAVAEPMIITLIGEKWRPAVIYLQMLCFVGMFYPLSSLNLNMLNVLGRSDLFLRLEIIKKILAVPTIVIGVIWGIKVMLAGMMVNTLIAYYLNSYWSGRFINYPMKEQVKDILPSLCLALFSGLIVFMAGRWLPFGYLVTLICQLALGAFITIGVCEIFRMDSYRYLKDIFITQIATLRNGKTR